MKISFNHNLCFIIHSEKVLLLNRNKAPWMGRWNGVGGKLEGNETPRQAMHREIKEETGLHSLDLHFKGLITWSDVEQTYFGGLYLYLAHLAKQELSSTPIQTDEGILAWKELSWALHPENLGVASSVTSGLCNALTKSGCYAYHSVYRNNDVVAEKIQKISPTSENEVDLGTKYFNEYKEARSGS